MLTTEEIQAAELEQKVIPTDAIMDAYNEYHRLKAQRDALNAKMDACKALIKEFAEEKDAKNIIDPENGRNMVTVTVKSRETADKKLMIEDLGPEVVDMYFKKSVYTELRVN